MYRRILVPLERKGGAEGHMRHAAALASRVGAEITLLRVITVVPAKVQRRSEIPVLLVRDGEKGE